MPSSFSPRIGPRLWLVAAYRLALGAPVVALLGLWTSQGLVAHDATAPWSLVGASSPAIVEVDDQSPDEGEAPPALEAEGVNLIHPSVSLAPFENIDLTSGNVSLLINLLSLPGNGLIDLDVILSFNSKHWRWDIGPGQLVEGETTHVSVRSADGTKHELARQTGQPTEFLTTDFWHYSSTTHLLQLPNGVTILYGKHNAGSYYWYPTLESDPFGNTLAYTYIDGPNGPLLSSIVQNLGGGEQREVDFTYDVETGVLQTMTYGAGTWTFEWANPQDLHRVNLATHGAWVFDRTTPASGVQQFVVTTPTGGSVMYEIMQLETDTVLGPMGQNEHPIYRGFVTSRTTTGPQLAAGTWTFGYPCSGGCVPFDDGVGYGRRFRDPDGTTTAYVLDETTGLALSRSVVPDGQSEPIETATIVPSDLEFMVIGNGSGGDVRVPLVLAKNTMRDGFTYRTEYTYGPRDPGQWADYAHPRRITSFGDFTRTTAFTYRHDFGSRYIRGKVASVTVDPDGPAPVVSSCLYDDYGFMTSKTVEGITTTYARDIRGNLSSVADGVKPAITYAHEWGQTSDANTALYTIKRHFTATGTVDWFARDSANGSFVRTRTLLEHADALERETLRTPPAGLPTATTYEHEADAVSALAPDETGPYVEVSRGTTWTRTYVDGYGRTRRTAVNPPTIDGPTTVWTKRYDALGRKEFESLPFTDTEIGTSYTYDALGRVKTRTSASKTTTYSYSRSAEGATVTITEPFGSGGSRTTVQTWQASGGPGGGRLVRVHDAKGDDTTYGYNVLDKLTVVHAPGVLDREYHYFPGTSRLAYEVQPESGRTDYTYYLNGMPQTRTDALGHVVTLEYDEVNRVQHSIMSADAEYTTDMTYDNPSSDNPLTIANGYVSSTFTYDVASRPTSRVDTIHVTTGDSGRTFTTLYEPNGYDQVAQITYPSGRVVTYAFDGQQRIQSVSDGVRPYASGILYHPSGQVVSFTSGNGVPSSFTYDSDTYRPTGVTHGNAGTVLSLAYTYFDEGNVRAIQDGRPGMSLDLAYGYDPVDRLIQAAGPWGTLTYDYDATGNRTLRTVAGQTTEYHYDEGHHNWLSATTVGGVVSEGFSYNDLGQLVADGRGLYSYTPGGLLETAQMAAGLTVTHRYDGDGMRTVKIKGSVPHYYVRGPGGQLLAEYKVSGGELAWDVDYIYADSRLLAAVRPDVSYMVTISMGGTGTGQVTAEPLAAQTTEPSAASR